MRKMKGILVLSLVMLMALSSVAYATVVSDKENVRNIEYSEDYIGSKTLFCAVGNVNEVYTTLTNRSDTTYYMTAGVNEYVYDTGWVYRKSNCSNVEPGLQVVSDRRERDIDSYIRYYQHTATCSRSQYYSSVVDDYSFVANQYH